ncbi:two-component system, chemotaxis family, response regulator CheY [Pelagirhabdus alkalitolerans]|uniref:Two-component system, chemotaxis family, response regulator CheY n=1 Tax=Pelagirhabdus alkalitolerans TaxID=1612202 RepID=A0A1G6KN21_9BACI|nr:response regulator [Pelagirhabdus alkalitolerans]SDC32374.1 two-component system, chemotaxis family, response regulator CheY [Pelagirhabdus alkalitolerans]
MYSVLIVDDSSFMRKWLMSIVAKGGYIISGEAKNGYEAILQYRKLKPDLVLLDIHMPELAGNEVLKRIMAIDPDASIIMCSAIGSSFIVEECLSLGAKDFVRKPNFGGLLDKMNQIIQMKNPDH